MKCVCPPAQDLIKDMKRRFKIMNHQIEQLKDEITVMDHSLVRVPFLLFSRPVCSTGILCTSGALSDIRTPAPRNTSQVAKHCACDFLMVCPLRDFLLQNPHRHYDGVCMFKFLPPIVTCLVYDILLKLIACYASFARGR